MLQELIKQCLLNEQYNNSKNNDNNNRDKDYKLEHLTNLWGNYGEILALSWNNNNNNDNHNESCVIKQVDCCALPNIINKKYDECNMTLSFHRKAVSYLNEMCFYYNIIDDNKCVLESDVELFRNNDDNKSAFHLIKTDINVPKPLFISLKSNSTYTAKLILTLEDLRVNWPNHVGQLNMQQAKLVIEWLAKFHATFWNNIPHNMIAIQGTYWYLDTRPNELQTLCELKGSFYTRLYNASKAIDLLLKQHAYTLCHGDFKTANILFSEDYRQCILYDFQYVGKATPLKDFCNLINGSVNKHVYNNVYKLLDHYYEHLQLHLEKRQMTIPPKSIFKDLYLLCLADLVRFRLGWGMYGVDVDSTLKTVEILLNKLDNGATNWSTSDYTKSLKNTYPLLY